MCKVQYKSSNAAQSWSTYGMYNENGALGTAERIAGRYFMVRVVDPDGYVVWTA